MSITERTVRAFDLAPDAVLLTQREYARHREQLDALRRVRDSELPRLLRDARTYVLNDAIEEIAQIEEDDAIAQARISKLQDLLDGATVVPDDAVDDDVVTVGRTVEVLYMRSGQTASFGVAGTARSGGPRTVSARSPVGQAIMGRSRGDVVAVELPGDR